MQTTLKRLSQNNAKEFVENIIINNAADLKSSYKTYKQSETKCSKIV